MNPALIERPFVNRGKALPTAKDAGANFAGNLPSPGDTKADSREGLVEPLKPPSVYHERNGRLVVD